MGYGNVEEMKEELEEAERVKVQIESGYVREGLRSMIDDKDRADDEKNREWGISAFDSRQDGLDQIGGMQDDNDS